VPCQIAFEQVTVTLSVLNVIEHRDAIYETGRKSGAKATQYKLAVPQGKSKNVFPLSLEIDKYSFNLFCAGFRTAINMKWLYQQGTCFDFLSRVLEQELHFLF